MRFVELMAIAVAASGCCGAVDTRGTFERTISVTGPVVLDLRTDSGGITLTSGSPGLVRMRGTLSSQPGFLNSLFNTEERIRRIESNPPIEKNGNTIRAGWVNDQRQLFGISMRLEIEAPSDSQVRARADSGDIRIQGFNRSIECRTDSGHIEASHIGSELKASADSGDVEASDISGSVNIQTDSGAVHIRRVQGPVRLRADSGNIEALEIAGSIDVQTDSGGIHIAQTIPAAVVARADSGETIVKLAPGGYNVRLKSESGGITVPEGTVSGTVKKHEVEGKLRGGGPLVIAQVGSGRLAVE